MKKRISIIGWAIIALMSLLVYQLASAQNDCQEMPESYTLIHDFVSVDGLDKPRLTIGFTIYSDNGLEVPITTSFTFFAGHWSSVPVIYDEYEPTTLCFNSVLNMQAYTLSILNGEPLPIELDPPDGYDTILRAIYEKIKVVHLPVMMAGES